MVAGMSAANLAALERGQPVARVLESDRREIAIVGSVRIRGSRHRLVARYRDVTNLRKSSLVLELGVFGSPSRAEDLEALTFEDYDLEAVRECEPGDCAVRLSASSMARFQQAVNWKSPEWGREAAATWRQVLADLLASYQVHGDQGLPEYHNRDAALRVQEEFQVLYRQSSYLSRMAPEAFRHVREFPRARLDRAEDIFYWSKDDFGLRPVTSLTHLTVYEPPHPEPALIATKQIYAAHYFDAALGITLVLDDDAGSFYVVSVNRARTRSLTSRFRGFIRSIVQGRSRDALERILASMKQSIEVPASPGRE